MTELKIDPEFENLIPKLTDAEYAQLEKNILADGKIKDPITVWNGTIIDGHHRYRIAQKHPEIPFETDEKTFSNKYEVKAWICANQLGRRNLSQPERDCLLGDLYTNEKLAVGGNGSNQYKEEQKAQNELLADSNATAARIGKENGVARETVKRAEQYSKGMKAIGEIDPELREEIMAGKVKVPKTIVQDLSKVTPDKQRKASIAISKREIEKAREILDGDSPDKQESLKQYGLEDDGKEVEFTIDDLYSDIETNFEKCMDGLENTVSLHKDILDDESKQNLIDKLKKLFDQKVRKFMEGI